MQGQQDSQRVLFDTIDLERLISDDHLLRGIDARIDFDFIYEVTEVVIQQVVATITPMNRYAKFRISPTLPACLLLATNSRLMGHICIGRSIQFLSFD